jgi:SdpI/YhfL family protein
MIELFVGGGALTLAALGARSRLRRNRLVGVRTEATMRTGRTFEVANRAAAVPIAAAGAVALLSGGALVTGADGAAGWVVLVVGLLGTVALLGLGGMVGNRAATAVPTAAPPASDCAGSCAGCDLVAGCRTGAAPEAGTAGS